MNKTFIDLFKVFLIVVLIFMVIVFFISFLKPDPPKPTPTVQPTWVVTHVPTVTTAPTLAPTKTPVPTKTPKPTPTEKPAPTTTPLPTPWVEYTKSGGWSHIRQGPGKGFLPLWWYGEDFAIIGGWLPDGTAVVVLQCVGEEPSQWVEVDFLGRTGYIYSPLVTGAVCK